jgi:hypothetical protein
MTIVKATYTRSSGGAKASIRYIEHRPGKEGQKLTRTLFNGDGALARRQAYALIDQAATGSIFFRFVINPDTNKEDTAKDLSLREVTEQTMHTLEERLNKEVHWVAAVHDDHTPLRHVHILAIVSGRLQVQDFEALRHSATQAALEQRRHRDLAQEQAREREEAQWEQEV